MLNPVQILSRGNRAQRRLAAKIMGIPLDAYPATMTPIDLGIKEYKRNHLAESKRIRYYKEEMWKAFHELKGKDGRK